MMSPAVSSPSSFSLKEILRKRLLTDMIRLVQPAARWKVLVVDPISIKFLNAAMKMYDILEENVTLVELITRKRQPYPNLEAIYFLSPTPESIDYFICDFVPGGGKKQLYSAAHLFFTGSLPDPLMGKLTSSGAAKSIKNLKELYVDFLALESRLFSLDSPSSFFRLYSPDSGGIHAQNAELDKIAKQLLSVCATLGENPYIRYHRPLGSDANSNRSQKLAYMIQNELDNLRNIDPDFPPQGEFPHPRATLVIVDRTIDVTAPIVHEFTYQAMAHDLLELADGKYSLGATSPDGSNQSKDIQLDESDQIWVSVRHLHIAETISYIMAQLNKFTSENKAASAEIRGEKSPRDVTSLKDMRDTLAAMPQYQELKQKYSVHINMAQQCMDLFEKRKLAKSAAVEQDMATGETADGSVPKNIVTEMVPLLDDDLISPHDKVRLLMLYIISKEGVQDEDRRKLLDHARISLELAESITNLALLGVKLTKAPKEKRNKGKSNRQKRRADDVPYELSRYVPALKYTMEDSVNNTLDTSLYPYLRDNPDMEKDQPKAVGQSLRSTKPSWQKKGNEKTDVKGKLIVFILGGVSYSEVRSAYEVTQTSNREVIIGSTHTIVPKKFIDDLMNLRNPSAFKLPEYGFNPGPQPLPELTEKEKKRLSKEEAKMAKGKVKVDGGAASGAGGAPEGKEGKKKKKILGLF
ncbi:Sec1-like protein [Paraphysoderma sedebokerense]|nr:Sec1-like protein [Paraphysoderma sedebokerense]